MGFETRSNASGEPPKRPEINPASLMGGLDRGLGTLVSIHELPKPDSKSKNSEGTKDEMRDMVSGRKVLGTLVAAYHAAEPVLFAWKRDDRGTAVQLITGGESLVGDEKRGEERVLNFPPGAKGREVASADLDSSFSEFKHWQRIQAKRIHPSKQDSELVSDGVKELFGTELSLENSLMKAHHGPFVYLLHAAPVPRDEVDDLHVQKEMEANEAKAFSANSSEKRIKADALEEEQRELIQAQSLGLWDVTLLVGAKSEKEVRRIAGSIASSAMTSKQIYIPEKDVFDSIKDALENARSNTSPDRVHSTTASLSSLFSYPKKELQGVRLVARPDFDVNVEKVRGDDNSKHVNLGTVLDNTDFPAGEFTIPVDSLTRHAFIGGMTGSGKSETTRSLVEGLSKQGVTWTVLEPAKAEHRVMGARLAGQDLPDQFREVAVIRPGALDSIPAGINPLAPVQGFPLLDHIGNIRSVFENALAGDAEGQEIVKRYLRLAFYGNKDVELQGIYEEKGWDIKTGKSLLQGVDPQYPTLKDLQEKMGDIVDKLPYGEEVSGNMKGYMESKIGSLRTGAPGQFLEGAHPIDMSKLLASNTVIELEGVGDGSDLSFIMGLVLIQAREQLQVEHKTRDTGGAVPLKHVFVVEEAHHPFGKAANGESSDVSDRLANLVAEVRAYGVGIVLVDQIPSDLHKGALRNTSLKVLHMTPAKEDRDAVGETMNLTDPQSDYATTLAPGEVIAFTVGMDNPIRIQMPNPDDKPNDKNQVISPNKIIERRHGGACGAECQNDACSIRQISRANDILDRMPEGRILTAWADFAVVGELLELGDIKPDEKWIKEKEIPYFDSIKKMDKRTRECAVGAVVTAAVNNRALDIKSEHSLDEFKSHVARKLNAQINGEEDTDEDKGKVALRPNHRMNTSLMDAAIGLSFQDAEKAGKPDAWRKIFMPVLNFFELDQRTRDVFIAAYSNPSQSIRKENI